MHETYGKPGQKAKALAAEAKAKAVATALKQKEQEHTKELQARGQTCGAPEAAEEAAVEAGDTSTRATHDFGNALAGQHLTAA